MSRKSIDSRSFAAAAQEFADGVAHICRLYGVTPLAGRLYAALFLAPRPMSLEELCAQTGAAKSSVSVALRSLASARVARRLPPRGDRRDYYEAVTDPWQVLADWNQLYFEPEIEMFRRTGDALERALAGAADAPGGEAADELRRRIAAMRELSELFESLFGRLERSRSGPAPARAIAIRVEPGPAAAPRDGGGGGLPPGGEPR